MIFGWILLSLVLGFIGSNRSIGFWGSFLISLVLSPIIGFIVILFSKDKADENYKQKILKQQQQIIETNRHNAQLQNQSAKEGDKFDKIEKLFSMKEKGILTEEEYENEKKNILIKYS